MGLIDQLYDLQNQLAEIEEAAKKMIRSRDDRIAALEAQNAELVEALSGILEIGKRDMSNPKYDGYFDFARAIHAKYK